MQEEEDAEAAAKVTSVDDVIKMSSEYNNAANLSREYRSASNVVHLEGALFSLLAYLLTYSVQCHRVMSIITRTTKVLVNLSINQSSKQSICE